jgi:hypothetical protein
MKMSRYVGAIDQGTTSTRFIVRRPAAELGDDAHLDAVDDSPAAGVSDPLLGQSCCAFVRLGLIHLV